VQPQRHVDKAEQHGYLDERADDSGQGLAGGGAEDDDGDRDIASLKSLLAAENASAAVRG
jgi:hypothetical protein